MSSEHRNRSTDLIHRLLREPWRFEAFQALRILERAIVHAGGPASHSSHWPVRFRNTISLRFAPSDVEAVQVTLGGLPLPPGHESVAALGQSDARVEVVQPIIGLLGVSGALPARYTEALLGGEGQRRRPEARAFLDLVSHRAVTLWYRAWKYRHPALQRETERRGGVVDVLRAVAGMGLESQREMLGSDGGIPDHSIAGFAAALRHGPMSAPYFARILSTYFGYVVQVQDFVASWHPIPPETRSRLGQSGSTLGRDAILGERHWQRHLRIRIKLGPLPLAAYQRFLPDGPDTRVLAQWVLLCLGDVYEVEVVPILRAADVVAACLGRNGRLGRDAFLDPGQASRDRDDAAFLLPPLPEGSP
ncbi:type VI secretion system baseplate subunit TssG [Luteibacter sp.]|uniref:type VI secretion system baseplate subunit TssG n=1 Tax=Luteibacter sp. TaxID=1886636 RepID=UPI002F427C04